MAKKPDWLSCQFTAGRAFSSKHFVNDAVASVRDFLMEL
jgi:hypothetical protein